MKFIIIFFNHRNLNSFIFIICSRVKIILFQKNREKIKKLNSIFYYHIICNHTIFFNRWSFFLIILSINIREFATQNINKLYKEYKKWMGWNLWRDRVYIRGMLNSITRCLQPAYLCGHSIIVRIQKKVSSLTRRKTNIIRLKTKKTKYFLIFFLFLSLPHRTLFQWVHRRSKRTFIGFSKVYWVGERSEHADGSWRVHGGSNLGKGVLRPHRAAPDLRVVEEEQLFVGQRDAGQAVLHSVLRHPLLVCLQRHETCVTMIKSTRKIKSRDYTYSLQENVQISCTK